jgi:hypothetical protein
MQSVLQRWFIRFGMLALLVPGVVPSLSAQEHEVGHWFGLYSVGLVRGQAFRISIPNLPPPGVPERSAGPLRVFVRAVDQDGRVLAEAELEAPLGQTVHFDLDRDAIPRAGETLTGRLQVAVQLFFVGKLKVTGNLLPNVGSAEIVDKETGKTAAIAIPNLIEARKGGTDIP